MTRISQLPDGSGLIADEDLLPFVDVSAGYHTKRVTAGSLLGYQVLNVQRFGAKVGADSTTAIQAALTEATALGGAFVHIPASYIVSAPLVVGAIGSVTSGVRIVGLGPYTSSLIPTADFGSDPIIKFINGRACGVEDLSIRGNAIAPQACIESHCNTPGIGNPSPTNMQFRRLWLGEAVMGGAANTLQYGIRFTAATDQNNDMAIIEDVNVIYFTEAAISIEHSNSLLHTISGGNFQQGAMGVKLVGGSFTMQGTALNEITIADFWFENGAYHHPILIQAKSENNTGTEGAVLVTGTSSTAAPLDVRFVGYNRLGAAPTVGQVDFQSVGGRIDFVGCNLDFGQTGQMFIQASSTARGSFVGCRLGFTDYTINGEMTFAGNSHSPGTVTVTKGGSAKVYRVGDTGGGLPVIELPNLTVPTDLLLSTNATYLKGHTSGGTDVKLMGLTSDANNITRFFAGVDAGGFQWVNQAAGSAWAKLLSSYFTTRRVGGYGTAHVAGDYVLSGGWGATASVSSIAAQDMAGRVSITATATGIAANPTVTLTFKDGTWSQVPGIIVSRGDTAAPDGGDWRYTSPSATAPVFTFVGLPVAGNIYILEFKVTGKVQ